MRISEMEFLLEQSMAMLAIALNRSMTEVALSIHEIDDIRNLLAYYKERK